MLNAIYYFFIKLAIFRFAPIFFGLIRISDAISIGVCRGHTCVKYENFTFDRVDGGIRHSM